MIAKLALEGVYSLTGLVLTSDAKPFRLIIDTRRNPDSRKPPRYMLAKTVDGSDFPETGTRSQYVSSLYPLKDGPGYWIEYGHKQYHVEVDENRVTITPRTQTVENGLVYQKPFCTTVVHDVQKPDPVC